VPDVALNLPGTVAWSCRPAFSYLASRLGAANPSLGARSAADMGSGWVQVRRSRRPATLHLAALAVMAFTETDLVAALAFLLTWGPEFLLARPVAPSRGRGALSLTMVVILVLVSGGSSTRSSRSPRTSSM